MDYPLSGLLVISWSVVSSIHFFLAIGIDALSQIRWMNHQRPFQSQSFDKTGEHNSPKLYPFVPERASISRRKKRLQDQDHSWTLILLASLKNFSILCARAFARSRKRVVVGKKVCWLILFYALAYVQNPTARRACQVRATRNSETCTSLSVSYFQALLRFR